MAMVKSRRWANTVNLGQGVKLANAFKRTMRRFAPAWTLSFNSSCRTMRRSSELDGTEDAPDA